MSVLALQMVTPHCPAGWLEADTKYEQFSAILDPHSSVTENNNVKQTLIFEKKEGTTM